MAVLAELNVRHTRRHMPTRRVALDACSMPTTGPAYGAVLLGAVVAEFAGGLDEEQLEMLPRFVRDARDGLFVPRIALRHRLQTDMHGLDRSRHRILDEQGHLVLELDVHGHPAPQVLGAVMAAAGLPRPARAVAVRSIDGAVQHLGRFPEGFAVRRMLHGLAGQRPTAPGSAWRRADTDLDDPWFGVGVDHRWALEVLGLRAEHADGFDRSDVQRRFRRLVRQAHPDHGGTSVDAAERIAELTEARELLLDRLSASASSIRRS